MNKYEAMVIVKPDLSEEERKTLFKQIDDAVTKNKGIINSSGLWQEKKKLFFPIKKQLEGVYYLVNFSSPSQAIKEIRHTYSLNESILRVLFTRLEE